jgi:hypothetical protein
MQDTNGLDSRARELYERTTRHVRDRKPWADLDLADPLDREVRGRYLVAAAREWISRREVPIRREPAW